MLYYVRANNGLESFNRYLKEDCTRHVQGSILELLRSLMPWLHKYAVQYTPSTHAKDRRSVEMNQHSKVNLTLSDWEYCYNYICDVRDKKKVSFAAVASDCWLTTSNEVSVADFERMEATTMYAQFNGTSSFQSFNDYATMISTVHMSLNTTGI